MKVTIKRIWKSISRVNGNSLAEFATVSALMATLAATAAPKLSEVSEGTKSQKSMNEIDKLLTQAKNFYQDTADTEGRGRFPGQDKFDKHVGDHTSLQAIYDDLVDPETGTIGSFKRWSSDDGDDWASVFGSTEADAYNGGTDEDVYRLHDTEGGCISCTGAGQWDDDLETANDCTHCTGGAGAVEWLNLMGGSAMASPFQDGHYIYVVWPGGGSGADAYAPKLFIADAENPTDFNAVLEP